jgi:diguanylate cyclase (GGDEF)-like protein
LQGTADALVANFGGPEHYTFVVTDPSGRTLLSVPGGDMTLNANPIGAGQWLSGSAAVPTGGWTVTAGVRSSVALGQTRSTLLRELELAIGALIVFVVLLAIVNRRIAVPLRHLTRIMSRADHHVPPATGIGGPSEVVQLTSEFNKMLATRDAYESRLAEQALHDPLTGLPNRALLADRLTHAVEQASVAGHTVAVLFIDVDGFKLVNDTFGHTTGDQALAMMAERLAAVLQPGDTLARFGGDEFVIVRDHVTDPGQADELAAALLTAVAAPFEVADTIITLTASVGICLSVPGQRPDDLIRDADTAMYAAKELGRGRLRRFDAGLREQVTNRLSLENDLRLALDHGELTLAYQPVVNLETGETVGLEALLRWNHPALGSIPPAVFIPIAEETGLIGPIGNFVLHQACQQAAAFRSAGLDLIVSINISGRQLADPALLGQVTAALATAGIDPHLICLELTESVLMSDPARTASTLRALKVLGLSISIDDFGTGYSSLAYLNQFPADELKIDRSFIDDITGTGETRTLVAAMIAMGIALGLDVVAEGVETEAQAEALRDLNCERAQGYLFARPQSATAVTSRLKTRLATKGVRRS